MHNAECKIGKNPGVKKFVMRPKLYTPIQKKVIKVEELDDVKTSLITTRRIVFTPSVDVKEDVQGISIQITCLDEDGTVLKQVNSADSGTIEDNENSLTPDPNTVANGDSPSGLRQNRRFFPSSGTERH